MREIKFRAWDEELECMYSGDEIEVREELNSWLSYGELAIYRTNVEGDYAQLKPLQFTGLHDKNGVEIYEGDILTSWIYPFQDHGDYNYHGVVEWIDELASFYMTKRVANKHIGGISDGISEPIENIDSFEVIGNTYQHPHLLEESK